MVSAVSTTGASLAGLMPVGAADRAAGDRPGLPRQAESGQAQDAGDSPDGLTEQERRAVAELRRTDRRVRAHEQAHIAAAAGLVRGVSFTFVMGPDGRQYVVGGEVSLDTSPVPGDPEATIRKAQQIRAAANAPADPSSQDRAVAAQASQMEQAARLELAEERRAELDEQNRASQAQAFERQGSPAGSQLSLLV